MFKIFIRAVAVLVATGIVTFLLLVSIEIVIFFKLRSNFDRDRVRLATFRSLAPVSINSAAASRALSRHAARMGGTMVNSSNNRSETQSKPPPPQLQI